MRVMYVCLWIPLVGNDFGVSCEIPLCHFLCVEDYEAVVLSKPEVEVRMGTGSLTMVWSSPPLKTDSNSLFSSCTRTEGKH